MFYSHEILTDRQYGVATIWIVATIGSRSQTRRITRKAIQEVEIQKACEKIIEPGAPIALRLQSSLLFGVSGVFRQQCQYLLTDAQKVNFHMNAFFKNLTTNELDPEAGQGRRENLMIMDDPDFASGFIPQMPAFDASMVLVNSNGRNNTQKTSSQMSPPSLASGSGSASSQERYQLQLDVPHSDTPDLHQSPRGLQGLSSGQKPEPLVGVGDVFGEEEFGASADWGFNVDEEGNIVESAAIEPAIFGDDLDLPPMPSIEGDNLPQPAEKEQQQQMDEQGGVIIMDEQPLPDVEALPQAHGDDQQAHQHTSPEGDKQGDATTQRKRKRKIIHPDEKLEISRNILRDWQDPNGYRDNCCQPKRHKTTAAEARKNAIHLTFGLGLANIGQNLGIPGMIHPLAVQYSGDSLFTAMTGLEVFNDHISRKRLRSASEDIEDPEGEGRRVRPRLEEQEDAEDAQHQGRGDQNGDDIFGPGDEGSDQLPEVGRERQSALDDHPSSAMPWNRNSSVIPGSSVRGQQQFGRDQPSSPLNKRAGSVQDIVRYSDSADVGGGGDFDFGFGGDSGNSNGSGSDPGFIPLPAEGGDININTQQRNQYAREFLDREGANFLSYMEQTIAESGERRHDEDFEKQRKWVAFDDVFVPVRTDRATAAQAFYHVLGLVTRGRMVVEQVGIPQEPFGAIHVGVKIDSGG